MKGVHKLSSSTLKEIPTFRSNVSLGFAPKEFCSKMNQKQKAQEKKTPHLSNTFCLFLTICCYNSPTFFHSMLSALKRLMFLLKIIREAVTVNIQNLFKFVLFCFFFWHSNCSRGGGQRWTVALDSLSPTGGTGDTTAGLLHIQPTQMPKGCSCAQHGRAGFSSTKAIAARRSQQHEIRAISNIIQTQIFKGKC